MPDPFDHHNDSWWYHTCIRHSSHCFFLCLFVEATHWFLAAHVPHACEAIHIRKAAPVCGPLHYWWLLCLRCCRIQWLLFHHNFSLPVSLLMKRVQKLACDFLQFSSDQNACLLPGCPTETLTQFRNMGLQLALRQEHPSMSCLWSLMKTHLPCAWTAHHLPWLADARSKPIPAALGPLHWDRASASSWDCGKIIWQSFKANEVFCLTEHQHQSIAAVVRM